MSRITGRSHRRAALGGNCCWPSWRKLDLSRVHFTGKVPHPALLALLSLSAAHVYLTYPFVLSWSMLEAMACECLVIGSATPPVQEVIEHGRNGLLVDFFAPDQIAAAVIGALADPAAMQPLRRAARETILSYYDLRQVCLPQLLGLVEKVARDQAVSVVG
ncbi:glycosyltransferase [Siccirubricoccus deserti]